jgi:hypothetical protein
MQLITKIKNIAILKILNIHVWQGSAREFPLKTTESRPRTDQNCMIQIKHDKQ